MCKRRRGNKFTPAANGGKWIAKKKRLAIYLRDGLACVYCRKRLEDGIKLQLDHFIRPQDGGSNMADNVVTACAFCNNSKSNNTIRQWYKRMRARGYDTCKVGRYVRRQMNKDLTPFLAEAELTIRRRNQDKVAA